MALSLEDIKKIGGNKSGGNFSIEDIKGIAPKSYEAPQTANQQTSQQSPIQSLFQQIGTTIGNVFQTKPAIDIPQTGLVNPASQNNLSNSGIKMGAGEAPTPVQDTQSFKNMKTSSQTQQDMVTDPVTRFASAGVAYQKIFDEAVGSKNKISDFDKSLLKYQNLIDENGKTKIEKVIDVTGQNAVDVAIFLAGSPLSAVEKTIGEKIAGNVGVKIAGKIYSMAPITGRAISWGILGLLGTKNLDEIIKDPEVRKEAVINTILGMGLGTITKIPETFFKSKYVADPAEVEKLYKDLAKKFHPDAGGNTESFKKLTTLVEDVKSGTKSVKELRALANMTPEELASKAISKAEKKPTALLGNGDKPQPTKEAPKVKEEPILGNSGKPVDEVTAVKTRELIAKDIAQPMSEKMDMEGYKRFYQAITKDGSTDWYFDTPEDLAKYMNLNTSKDTVFQFKDIKASDMVKDPVRQGVWRPKTADYQDSATKSLIKTEPVTTIAPTKPASPKPLTPTGTGPTKVSSLGVGVEQKAVERQLTEGFSDLPEFKQLNIKDQAKKAVELLAKDEEKAIKIALGQVNPPKGLVPESVYIAVENKALEEGRVDLLKQLATSSLVSEDTAMGQRIRVLAERNPDSPVTQMKNLISARKTAIEEKYNQPVEKLVKQTVEKIKKNIVKPTKGDWEAFIKEIEC